MHNEILRIIGVAFFCIFFVVLHHLAAETIQLERQGGTYTVPVQINGAMTLPFMLDTGSSAVAIPEDVFLTLTRTGTVNMSDFVGSGTVVLADGSEQASRRYVLHEVRVGDHVVKNVIASVISVKGDPLLGQSFLSKLPGWSIDNQKQVLVLGDIGTPQAQRQNDGPPSWNGAASPTQTAIARHAASTFDATFRRSGMTGVNIRLAKCYERAVQLRSETEVESCAVLGVIAARVANAFYNDLDRRGESHPADSRTSFDSLMLRTTHALMAIGTDPNRMGDLWVAWIKTSNLADEILRERR
jgi:clan AA aspartic protease (TIGR02281 family)